MPDPRRWRALSICLIAGFMTLLDVSIVNVALPSMEHGIGASAADVSWVVSGYALTFGLALVPAGRLGDDYGRKRMFLLGLVLFVATSALCGAAQNATWLVVARLCQGVAGGLLNPQVIGMIQQLFRGRERGRAFGLFGGTVGLSTAIGPVLGGLLIQGFGVSEGWRYVFYVNLPIGLIALLFGLRVLPGDHHAGRKRAPDLLGAILLGLAVVSVMLPLVEEENQTSAPRWWLMGVGAGLLVLFGLWERWMERGNRHPLVALRLLAVRSYSIGSLLGLVYFAGFTGIFLVITLFFQQGLGYSSLEAGASTLAFAIGSAISPPIGGRVVLRFGRPMVVLGILMVVIGLAATAYLVYHWHGGSVALVLAGPLFLAGLGSGLVIAPNQTLALEEVSPAEGGTAAGVLQTAQRVGSAVGTAIAGSLFFGQLSRSHGDFHDSAARALLGATGLVAIALVLGVADILLSRRRRGHIPMPPAPEPESLPVPPVDAADAAGLPAESALSVDSTRAVASAAVHGSVLDGAGNGMPATLTLTSLDGRQAGRAVTDGEGRFGIDAQPGSYLLLATAPDQTPVVRRFELRGEPVGLELTMDGSASLGGRVGAARGPVADATVTLVDASGEVRYVTSTDADGQYQIDGIKPGEYTVTAWGYAPTATSVSVRLGAQTRHDAVLHHTVFPS
ncbi:MAG TPA: MFS transporter [Pseudonocardiaceae bacterium]|nr:MFS transporter [Pseudonocardiaceae bacterium]